MNPLRPHSSPLPLLSRLLLFGHGGARTTVMPAGMRYASTEASAAVTTTPEPATPVPAAEVVTESAQRQGGAKQPRTVHPPGHGERLWVYNHIQANYIVYSLTPEMRSTKVFRQFAYTGKKLVPPKLRKDYWRPMAVVEFGTGKGDVGRNVFHKLRELLKRHQLEWDDEALLQMSRRRRGRALNDQRGNSVADLAAVLAGRGKGNLVALDEHDEQNEQKKHLKQSGGDKKNQEEVKGVVEVEVEQKKDSRDGEGEVVEKKAVKLHQATVYWANEQDKYYAQAWTDNVTHVVGLPEKEVKVEDGGDGEPVEAETAKAQAA